MCVRKKQGKHENWKAKILVIDCICELKVLKEYYVNRVSQVVKW